MVLEIITKAILYTLIIVFLILLLIHKGVEDGYANLDKEDINKLGVEFVVKTIPYLFMFELTLVSITTIFKNLIL